MRGSGKVGNLCSQVVAEKEAADRESGPRCPRCGGDLPCQCELLRGYGKGGNLRSHVVAEKEVRDCGPRCSQCGGDLPCRCMMLHGLLSGGGEYPCILVQSSPEWEVPATPDQQK